MVQAADGHLLTSLKATFTSGFAECQALNVFCYGIRTSEVVVSNLSTVSHNREYTRSACRSYDLRTSGFETGCNPCAKGKWQTIGTFWLPP